ncbi:hypothetical protein ACN38_g12241 [Penicillium nordicum]|uniref:Uncharacterized protein n=1 Tax=Penicillium nordicum TaxID=229535 RepID=A0A0M8NTJ1_9EURO|nr:hypothetical protein ACN38_g12241 [Penicillium nordicum]
MNWIRQREQVEEGTEYQKPKFGETPRLMGRLHTLRCLNYRPLSTPLYTVFCKLNLFIPIPQIISFFSNYPGPHKILPQIWSVAAASTPRSGYSHLQG